MVHQPCSRLFITNDACCDVTRVADHRGISHPRLTSCAVLVIGGGMASVSHSVRIVVQDSKSLMEVLQQIQVNHVHTVHETLAVADNIACSMPVSKQALQRMQ